MGDTTLTQLHSFRIMAAYNPASAQEVDKIMLDYDEESVLRCYEHTEGTNTTCKGTAEIREFFVGLFALLSDLSTLDAPVVEPSEDPKEVYLIWKCPGSGVASA